MHRTKTTYYIWHDDQEFEVPVEPIDGTEIVHIEGDRAVVGYLSYDEQAENPRDFSENFGTMVYFHRCYVLGDVDGSKEYGYGEDFLRHLAGKHSKKDVGDMEMEEVLKIINKHYTLLPLALYDHSGITMWVGSGAHMMDPGGWDSGQVGWIYVSLEKAIENWGLPKNSTWNTKMDEWDEHGKTGKKITLRKAAEKLMEGEVEEFDHYITGDVYGVCYATYTKDVNGNGWDPDLETQEVWGCYGHKHAKETLESDMEYWIEKIAERG